MSSLEEGKSKSIFKPVSRCMYCNSTSYGKGCRYAPHGVHFHPGDARKCAYCGSPNYGRGCKLNPTGDLHLHGINYNTMFSETLKNKFLLNMLNKDYKDFEAYKLGIINENGEKIKEPVTEQELLAYSPETKTILRIKKYLGSKLELINHTAILESAYKITYNKDSHKKLLEYEEKINNIFAQLHETANNALKEGLSVEQVQALLQ